MERVAPRAFRRGLEGLLAGGRSARGATRSTGVGLASLNTLDLRGCTAVSDVAVAALQASLPKLKIIP